MVTEPVVGLAVSGVTVRFGDTVAVDDVAIEVTPGEVVAVLGPSGCGKSTLLRVVAGLERPRVGTVMWNGDDVTARPPHERGFGLMFQDHALFPHRTVGENVGFGLRMAKVASGARAIRVAEMLELVGLAGTEDRTIDTLSGGEAQRVALARALAPSPKLLMLDEPLGSLDRSLRDRLAVDLRAILTDLGLAALHVTHDQEEAYTVADRLAVMEHGRIRRIGPVAEVWSQPETVATARFLGHENVLDAEDARALGIADGSCPVVVPDRAITVAVASVPSGDSTRSDAGTRPARVGDVRFQGPTSRVTLEVTVDQHTIALIAQMADPPARGDHVSLTVDPSQVIALSETGD